MAYKNTLHRNQEKDVKEFYHGTKLSCKITTSWKLCETRTCEICDISSLTLLLGAQETDSNDSVLDSTCHDYTQRYNGFKAILMCDVLPGRKYILPKLTDNICRVPLQDMIV